jgi:zinc and cadmium transporter
MLNQVSSAGLYMTVALVLDGVAGLAGGLLSEAWLYRHQRYLIGLAAGALVAAVFLDVLPEAFEAVGASTTRWAFAGFVALALLEWLVGGHHHRDGHEAREHEPPPTLPLTLLSSDALHNVADGAAIAAAFLSSPHAGVTVAVAVVAHEIPQEVGDYALLRASGWRRGRALLALAGVQVTAAIGALGILLAEDHFHHVVGAALALAAGSFLYIGATDLLPELHSGGSERDRRQRLLGFLTGIALVALASYVTG